MPIRNFSQLFCLSISLLIILIISQIHVVQAQESNNFSSVDTTHYSESDSTPTIPFRDSIRLPKQRIVKKYPPYFQQETSTFYLRNQQAKFGKKVLRGSGLTFAFQSATYGFLYLMPEKISNWDKNEFKNIKQNLKDAYTQAPVIDKDKWYINYIGHPLQGAYYYNAFRSQGSKCWQAGLMSLGHSMLWEYTIEATIEHPSIQDIIVTPIVGSLLGELFHFASIKMSRNGFKWYEKALVSILNPMFAINNGFKYASPVIVK